MCAHVGMNTTPGAPKMAPDSNDGNRELNAAIVQLWLKYPLGATPATKALYPN